MGKLIKSCSANGWVKVLETAGYDGTEADKYLIQATGGNTSHIALCESSEALPADDMDGIVLSGGDSGNAMIYALREGYDLYARSTTGENVKIIVHPLAEV